MDRHQNKRPEEKEENNEIYIIDREMYQDKEEVSNPKDAFPLHFKLFVVSLTGKKQPNK